MRNPINWFEIYVEDMERAKRFYETVFQVKLTRLENPELEMWTFPADRSSYGASGSLVRFPGAKVGENSVLIYFHSEDCFVEEARIIEAGGRIHRSKMSIGEYGFITLAHDTEGNMFGIRSMA